MSMQSTVRRSRKAAIALAAAGVVAGGSLSLAGGATAGDGGIEAGWPQASGSVSASRLSARAHGADLVVLSTQVRDETVDVGEAGESTGDVGHFEERLHQPGSDKVVGRDAAQCEIGIRSFKCSATFKIFGKGKIIVEGAVFSGRDNKFAITGGTGDYAGVGGTFRPFNEPDGTSRLVFFFTH